jgi:hypothetical protein
MPSLNHEPITSHHDGDLGMLTVADGGGQLDDLLVLRQRSVQQLLGKSSRHRVVRDHVLEEGPIERVTGQRGEVAREVVWIEAGKPVRCDVRPQRRNLLSISSASRGASLTSSSGHARSRSPTSSPREWGGR